MRRAAGDRRSPARYPSGRWWRSPDHANRPVRGGRVAAPVLCTMLAAWDNAAVTTPPSPTDGAGALRHVMVVGGTIAEWGALDDARWAERVDTLGAVAEQCGARWL